jgi:hypothetical protein
MNLNINVDDMVAVLYRMGRGDWQFVTYAVSKEIGWRMAAAVRGSEGKRIRTAVVKRKDFEEGRVRDIKPPHDFDPDAREPRQWILRCESSKTNDVWLLKDPRTCAYADEDKPQEAHKFDSIDAAKEALARIRDDDNVGYVNWRWSILEWDDELGLATMNDPPKADLQDILQDIVGSEDDLDF